MMGPGTMLQRALGLAAALGFLAAAPVLAATTAKEPKDVHWSFEGPFGKFDPEQLQRGYKVYHDVCSACHSMNLVHYYDLGRIYGPFYSAKYKNQNDNPYVKAIAKDVQIPDIDPDTGDRITRPGTSADHFKAPFANDVAAKASNGGAIPPDLSMITRAREGGPRYIYSILRGYEAPPPGLDVPAGKSYNAYMPGDLTGFWKGAKDKVPTGGFIAMPLQLTDDRVTYDDGVKATADQEAKDVTAFLEWAGDIHQTERKRMGFSVLIYLLLLAGAVYGSYRAIWRGVKH